MKDRIPTVKRKKKIEHGDNGSEFQQGMLNYTFRSISSDIFFIS